MEKEFLADVPVEGSDPFKDEETETTSESQPEKEPVKEEPKVEGDNTPEDEPFHKRWKEREDKLKQEFESKFNERDESYRRELDELKAFKEETKAKLPESNEVPDWFKELYGDNVSAYKKYAEHETALEEKRIERIFEKQQTLQKEQAEQVTKWNQWMEGEVSKLGTKTGIDFMSMNDVLPSGQMGNLRRNELMQIMLEYRPTDDKGNFNFDKGYEILENKKRLEIDPAKSEARKKLADTTTKTTTSEPKTQTAMSAEQLRKTPWHAL